MRTAASSRTLVARLACWLVLMIGASACQTTSEADHVIENHPWRQLLMDQPGARLDVLAFEWMDVRDRTRRVQFELPYVFVPAKGQADRTLLLVHGDPGGKEVWARFAACAADPSSPLTDGCALLAIDLPGHGQARHAEFVSRADVVADIVAAALDAGLRSLIAGELVVVGHSWGGEVATHLAANNEDVDKLVLVDAVGFLRRSQEVQSSERLVVSWFWGWLLGGIVADPLESDVRAGLEELYAPCNRCRLVCDDVPKLYRAYTNRSAGWWSNYWVSREIACRDVGRRDDRDTVRALGRIKIPTLLVWGSEDPAWTVSTQAMAFRRFLGTSRLAVIRGCGHSPTEERPDVVAQLVFAWLQAKPLAATAAAELVPPSDDWR